MIGYRADDGGDAHERAASSQRELGRGGESLEARRERSTGSVGHSGNQESGNKRSRGSVGRRARGTAPRQTGTDDAANAIFSTTVTHLISSLPTTRRCANVASESSSLQNSAGSNGSSARRCAGSTVADGVGAEQSYGPQQKYGTAADAAERTDQGTEAGNQYPALEHDALGSREGSVIGEREANDAQRDALFQRTIFTTILYIRRFSFFTDGFGREDGEDRRVGTRTGAQGSTNGGDAAAGSRLAA